MAYKYQTNFTINSTDGSEKIELRNPAQSGKKLELLKIGVVSDAGFEVFGLRRYDELATHDSPTQVEVYKWDPSGDAPVGEVYWGAASTISFQGSIDFVHDEQLDSGDGGDDAEIIFAKYFPGTEQVVIVENTSLQVTLPVGQANWTIKLVWQEVAS